MDSKVIFNKTTVIPKPWGREIIFTTGDLSYVGKVLVVKQGYRLSLQYHEIKEETQYLFKGKIRLTYGSVEELQSKMIKSGEVFHVPQRAIHRIEGIAVESFIFEVSTPHLQDVVRIEDDYRRK